MKRFVICYLKKHSKLPCAKEHAQRQIAWAQGGVVASSAAEVVRMLQKACEEASAWDEIILMTDVLLGPIGDARLEKMLSTMEKVDCEAWGIANEQFSGAAGNRVDRTFVALRRKLYLSDELAAVIGGVQQCPVDAIAAWIETAQRHYCCWMDFYGQQEENLVNLPYTAVIQYDMPFLDMSCLYQPHSELVAVSMGEETVRLFRLLEETVNMEWVWMRLLEQPYDYNLIENLGLIECLETREITSPAKREHRVCLLMHLYYQELGLEALHYARNVPDDVDIYVTTSSEEKRNFFSQLFAQLPNKVEIRVVRNRGRDMAGLLIGLRDVTARYDVCCFYHDKKSPSNAKASVGRSFAYMISESALASRGYVERILQRFQDEPMLGMMVSMVPHHGDYYMVATHFWDHNYPYVVKLLEQLGVSVAVREKSCVPAAWGNVFWFRTKALWPLLSYPWKHEDFPEEPYPIDGSIAHAIERAHCLIAQSQGYYTKLVAPTHLMTMQMMNFFQYWQDYANEMVRGQVIGPHNEVVRYCGKCLTCAEVRLKQKVNQWRHKWKKKN